MLTAWALLRIVCLYCSHINRQGDGIVCLLLARDVGASRRLRYHVHMLQERIRKWLMKRRYGK